MADFVSHHLFGRQALTVFPAPGAAGSGVPSGVLFLGLSGTGPAVLPENPAWQSAAQAGQPHALGENGRAVCGALACGCAT